MSVTADIGGRGFATLLVNAVLDDSIRDSVDIVPVCPLFAQQLNRHGAEFVAAGGRFRSPERADVMMVGRALRQLR
ncbi:N-acetyltransferase [Microbacterium sp. ET2]|uniref:N-acetyltransferase n=1 Tax=Microbacterium albipurpureum TaxID=3050384 RepID=UPI00259CB906|nr:N-acetyltransferase [Microbacterium sp. ET2 (Ac-2212)]WJL96631.1 N-acetyltransferase [Microbacterium sp. ET2 (Ac-2212)]